MPFVSVKCGSVGRRLNAHHIKPYCLYPELRMELSNGETLCDPCHKNTDSYGGKAVKMLREIKKKKS